MEYSLGQISLKIPELIDQAWQNIAEDRRPSREAYVERVDALARDMAQREGLRFDCAQWVLLKHFGAALMSIVPGSMPG